MVCALSANAEFLAETDIQFRPQPETFSGNSCTFFVVYVPIASQACLKHGHLEAMATEEHVNFWTLSLPSVLTSALLQVRSPAAQQL